MPSTKKPASSKRASFPREASYEKRFVKDWERLSRSGRYNMNQLKEAMMLLIANDAPLGPEWLDHALKGDWSDHRECHIGGDFLLIYTIEGNLVNFVRAGRSEEHTSELQSLMRISYAVFCLKKKKQHNRKLTLTKYDKIYTISCQVGLKKPVE